MSSDTASNQTTTLQQSQPANDPPTIISYEPEKPYIDAKHKQNESINSRRYNNSNIS
jgi:hypothetical protein